ncbi:MAG: MerR family transcriptional regulator [Solirubrobacterales bacterium]
MSIETRASEAPRANRERRSLTIGAVCKLVRREFPDISISKIRYLEDQGLLTPRRTQGGYRLYSPVDVTRLRTILRLQRDEFLPLRVIRQELASGRATAEADDDADARPPHVSLSATPTERLERTDLAAHAGVEERVVRELEEYGVIGPVKQNGRATFDEIDREIVSAVAELKHFGAAARNLRVFRTSAEREAALLEQMLGAALRSPNRDKRREAVESLENLAAVVSRLQHLLLVRDLRRLVG